MTYRSPAGLGEHGVLVVGASASGIQIADEIHRSGRPVTIAVGEHVRLPRIYRGRDIFWWMDAAGILDQRFDEVDDLVRARHLPSPQLIGTPERRTIDLNTLVERGVEIVGRLGRIDDGVAQFSGALANVCMLADLKLNRLLDTLDEWARTAGSTSTRRRRSTPTIRADPSATVTVARHRSAPRRHRHDHLGDRLPPRPLLARRPGVRPQGPDPPRRRCRVATRPACTCSAPTSCAGGGPASSTAPSPTPMN